MRSQPIPSSASALYNALEAGVCFRWTGRARVVYLEWAETVGPIYTECERDGSDPHTTAASTEDLRAFVRFGELEAVDAVPGWEVSR